MQQYYDETGTYRAEDLFRLLGNPTEGVSLNPDPAEMKNFFLSKFVPGPK
jgi:hypothetical protein